MKTLMTKARKVAAALEDGALQEYTVLLWLNDLAVSDIKETLKAGDNARDTQEHW